MIVSVDPKSNIVDFNEITIHSDYSNTATSYEFSESPIDFKNFEHDLILGGANIDGVRIGTATAKFANFLIGKGTLLESRISHYIKESRDEINSFNGDDIYVVPTNRERQKIFKEDLARLVEVSKKQAFNWIDTRDCSDILFRWLFDRYALLKDLCNELGIQLTLPCQSESSRNYIDAVSQDNPGFMLPMNFGKASLLDYEWKPLKEFKNDTAFIVKGHQTSINAFIGFVRHKLGGNHFDSTNRKKWHKDIVELSGYVDIDNNFMSHHMRGIVIAVLESVYENRIHAQLI